MGPITWFQRGNEEIEREGGRIVVDLSICIAILSRFTDVEESGVWI